jgi:CheY-like chemotaxis protein
MRILLVEDTDDSRDLYRVMLEQLGHSVFEATTGMEAVKLALKKYPDLVIMDLSMPEVNGCLATLALRSISPLRNLPVIAITAYPHQWKEKAEKAGCDAFLQKPFTLDDLTAVLQKFSPPI